MMDHHVRPRYLYLRDGICTHSSLCRRPLRLVEFHICYLLVHASIHDMLALMTRFQCITRYLHPLWRSCSLYIVRGNDHTWHLYIMPIHGHCTSGKWEITDQKNDQRPHINDHFWFGNHCWLIYSLLLRDQNWSFLFWSFIACQLVINLVIYLNQWPNIWPHLWPN